MKRYASWIVILAGLLAGPRTASAQDLVVAAASSVRDPLRELVERFEAATGGTVGLSLGSSGGFFAQISNGAPFDVFLAADIEYPRALERAGLIEPDSLTVYGIGRLALLAAPGSALDLDSGMEVLRDPRVGRIAIANPALAPYGRAAVEAMEAAGVYDAVSGKIVRAENVGQAAQFVSAGAADVGLVALALVRASDTFAGRIREIPPALYAPIEQGVVILGHARSAGHEEAARRFIDMLKGPGGRAILERYGFDVP